MWRETIVGLGALVLIASVVVWIFMQIEAPPSRTALPTHERYINERYSYAVSYPVGWNVLVYTPDHVSVGSTTPLGTDAAVEFSLAQSNEEFQNLTEFVYERAGLLCAADGPNESLFCDQVTSQETFTTSQGRGGLELYLRLMRTTADEATSMIYGPIYAFDMRGSATPFAVLLVYQPLPSFLEAPQPDLVREVARSYTVLD